MKNSTAFISTMASKKLFLLAYHISLVILMRDYKTRQTCAIKFLFSVS